MNEQTYTEHLHALIAAWLALGSYPISCPEDIARLLPPKGAAHGIAVLSEKSDMRQLSLFEVMT